MVGVARRIPLAFDRPSGSYTLSYDETRKQKKGQKKKEKKDKQHNHTSTHFFLWPHEQHAGTPP
jgi:hypothetical protein